MENDQPAIVFDFGGVLFDWNPLYLYKRLFHGDSSAAQRFLAEIDFTAWNLQQDHGRPFSEAVAEMTARFPQYAALIRAYDENWEEMMGGRIESTVAVLEQLHQAGYPLYALSNWSAEKFRLVRPQHPFLEWFDLIVLSGEMKLAKPDPRAFETFLRRAGRRAEECIFIDDSPANVTAAAALGFRVIHFVGAEALSSTLRDWRLLPAPKPNGARPSA